MRGKQIGRSTTAGVLQICGSCRELQLRLGVKPMYKRNLLLKSAMTLSLSESLSIGLRTNAVVIMRSSYYADHAYYAFVLRNISSPS